MGKVIVGVIVVLGIWVGMEIANHGPSGAFDGAFASFVDEAPAEEVDDRTTARRSGDAVARAHAEADARRNRMLGE